MIDNLVQILSAAVGSVGFAMIFRLRKERLFTVAVAGALTWAVYLVVYHWLDDSFIANLAASFFASLMSEVMAHRLKAPATIFLILALIPLVPGGSLYYTMRAVVDHQQLQAQMYGIATARTAGALAFGILLFTAVMHAIHGVRYKR